MPTGLWFTYCTPILTDPKLKLKEGVWVLSCFSCVQLFVTLWTVACQAVPSMGFSRQEYWSGLPFRPPWESSPSRDWTLVSYASCTVRCSSALAPPGNLKRDELRIITCWVSGKSDVCIWRCGFREPAPSCYSSVSSAWCTLTLHSLERITEQPHTEFKQPF